jgi:hypothetical protein
MGFRAKSALAASEYGSALHHSVTALSVKKALLITLRIEKAMPPVMLHPHTSVKMHITAALHDCAGGSVNE